LDIKGRSRKPQMALAEKFGITKYPNPAGGCLLTDPGFAKRVKDAMNHDEFNVENLALLSVGRHFRLAKHARLIVGRDDAENEMLLSMAGENDVMLRMRDCQGPVSVLRSKAPGELIKLSASITAYHTKLRNEKSLAVEYWKNGSSEIEIISVDPAGKAEVEGLRI